MSQLIDNLKESDLPVSLLQAMLIVKNHDRHNGMLVGGCVRDTLLGRIPKDYDIVTKGNLVNISEEFKSNGWAVKDVGNHFLVTMVSKYVGNKLESFEISNYRKDGVYTDGRRPDSVEVGTLEDDADRRDFTINTIYWNPLDLEYWDRHNGIRDIENKLIKFVGNPTDRIKEDYLRIFRAYRFASQLGFTLHPKTLKACRAHFNEAWHRTTPERARIEIEKMLKGTTNEI